jgi:purine-cytosine permease-like protein
MEAAAHEAEVTESSGGEFEREPVPESKTKGFRSFLGMYAGEHAAGTEFMIGPLFVVHGVSAFDVLVGLLIGNLLAVLSWTFLCAPIAAKKRLTLYYQLEKICGNRLVDLYNLANGVLFCFLAGAMISVSATAVGIPFGMEMPGLADMYPNSVGWVIAVFAVGAVISVVAAKGYDTVSHFANIAAPWMVLVFLACGVAALPQLGVHSLGDFWEVANTKVWNGIPAEGETPFSIWHVIFFAWFCNMAMHIGMADLSVFRFAKKARYGVASAGGMYLGHYMAWIAAGLLYAIQLMKNPEDTGVAPGPMAYNIAGLTGVWCVIVAGWTTANPTIYRAGLAFQAMRPKWSRFRVTMVAGAIATIGACFPALVMQLLGFVALYGLVLMPMGAIIFIDHYFMRKLGMKEYYAEKAGISFNWAAALTWFVTLGICIGMNKYAGVEIFFLGLPGWFIAAVLYIVLSKVIQRPTAAEGV